LKIKLFSFVLKNAVACYNAGAVIVNFEVVGLDPEQTKTGYVARRVSLFI
jgi:hypothetical protein